MLAAIFAVACVFLSKWQFDRREQEVAKIQRVAENYELPATPLTKTLLEKKDFTNLEWAQLSLTGKYLPASELLVRNRPIAGQPGFLQLVPFQLSSGEIILVERGWIPADSKLQPARDFKVSAETIELNGRIRLGEQTPNRQSPEGQVTSIRLTDLENLTGLNLETGFYLRLVSESPASEEYPQPLGKPVLDEGNHLSYAIQWILFAVMAFIALFWAIRQEIQSRRIEKDPNLRKPKKKSADDEAEDGDFMVLIS